MIARTLVEVDLVMDAGGKRSNFIFNSREPFCKQSSAMITPPSFANGVLFVIAMDYGWFAQTPRITALGAGSGVLWS